VTDEEQVLVDLAVAVLRQYFDEESDFFLSAVAKELLGIGEFGVCPSCGTNLAALERRRRYMRDYMRKRRQQK
jgi:hypothetical protein